MMILKSVPNDAPVCQWLRRGQAGGFEVAALLPSARPGPALSLDQLLSTLASTDPTQPLPFPSSNHRYDCITNTS